MTTGVSLTREEAASVDCIVFVLYLYLPDDVDPDDDGFRGRWRDAADLTRRQRSPTGRLVECKPVPVDRQVKVHIHRIHQCLEHFPPSEPLPAPPPTKKMSWKSYNRDNK